jgi:hypothetical protein
MRGNRSGGMVRLLSRGAEQHVQGILDDFCDRHGQKRYRSCR